MYQIYKIIVLTHRPTHWGLRVEMKADSHWSKIDLSEDLLDLRMFMT